MWRPHPGSAAASRGPRAGNTILYGRNTTLQEHYTAETTHYRNTRLLEHHTTGTLHCWNITLQEHYTTGTPHYRNTTVLSTTLQEHYTTGTPHCTNTTLLEHHTTGTLHDTILVQSVIHITLIHYTTVTRPRLLTGGQASSRHGLPRPWGSWKWKALYCSPLYTMLYCTQLYTALYCSHLYHLMTLYSAFEPCRILFYTSQLITLHTMLGYSF